MRAVPEGGGADVGDYQRRTITTNVLRYAGTHEYGKEVKGTVMTTELIEIFSSVHLASETGEVVEFSPADYRGNSGSDAEIVAAFDVMVDQLRTVVVDFIKRRRARMDNEVSKQNTCTHNWLAGYCDICGAIMKEQP